MTTEADRCLNIVRTNVQDALLNLNKVVVERISGIEEYNQEFISELANIHGKLLDIRNVLAGYHI